MKSLRFKESFSLMIEVIDLTSSSLFCLQCASIELYIENCIE